MGELGGGSSVRVLRPGVGWLPFVYYTYEYLGKILVCLFQHKDSICGSVLIVRGSTAFPTLGNGITTTGEPKKSGARKSGLHEHSWGTFVGEKKAFSVVPRLRSSGLEPKMSSPSQESKAKFGFEHGEFKLHSSSLRVFLFGRSAAPHPPKLGIKASLTNNSYRH